MAGCKGPGRRHARCLALGRACAVGRRFDGRGACQGQKGGEARQEGRAGSGCACCARLQVAPSAQAESASRG
eukprot:1621059-Prymnesium_polylepis.1